MKSLLAKVIVGLLGSCAMVTIAKEKLDPFFANQSLQQKAPNAFVLQPQAANFVRSAFAQTQLQADALVEGLKDHEELSDAIGRWSELSFEEQKPHLQKIIEFQCELMGVTVPELVLDPQLYPDRLAYFVFDHNNPDAGKVFLNETRFAEQEPVVTLALLIHETRHAYQFQMAYQQPGVLADAYKAAFAAQAELKPRSFGDFLTLANEYEAFQFSNLVIGELFDWKVDLPSMGTYASQYWADKRLKLDLLHLIEDDNPTPLIDLFNQQLQAQKQVLGR